MYFGWSNKDPTFVLEMEEESEQLKVVREDKGFDLLRGYRNTAPRVIKCESYAFRTQNYKRVYRYSPGSRKWSLCYTS